MMRILKHKRTLAAAGIAMVLVGGTIRLAVAQQAPAPTQTGTAGRPDHGRPGQGFLEALARQLGITTDRLEQAVKAARAEVGLPEGRRPGVGPGPRPGFRPGVRMGMQAAAGAVGISPEQLRQELPGKSVAQVAQAHGKNPAEVAAAIKREANQHIDEAVATGKLTAERAAQVRQNLDQYVDEMIDHVLRERPPIGPRPDGRGFREFRTQSSLLPALPGLGGRGLGYI